MLCFAARMARSPASEVSVAHARAVVALVLLAQNTALTTDWPQYRGPATDGSSPDAIATTWATNSPAFVVWRNTSLTNGFSSFAVSQGRAFVLISKEDGGNLMEYCVGVDAATGTNIWATPIGDEPWSPTATGDGGSGTAPYNTGDGPRTTPSVKDGRVVALSSGRYFPAQLHLVCLNATNGSVIWSNDLVAAYGASTIAWDNAASPCLDNDLVFVNLNSSANGQNLAAFQTADGSLAWSSQNENVTHTTPVVATIQGVRQVIFATQTGLVSLDRTTGALLWKFTYPFSPIGTSMGASPLVYSNLVYCTAAYNRGAFALRATLTGGAWTATQLWFKPSSAGLPYRSIWMSPVCYKGYVYTLAGENGTFLTAPLNCIELATGNLMWTTNNFGMGGLILVNTNLLVLTEKGQVVLVQPTPSAYQELIRYQAFQFSAAAPGKCWNSPAFSNGRIYARSTEGAISLDVSVPVRPALKLLSPQFLNSTQMQLTLSTVNGTPIDSNRLSNIEVRATNTLGASPAVWPKLTNPLVLTTNGLALLTNTIPGGQSNQVFITVEPP
jgi:outer membrane protein assembly factor BamB